MTAIARARGFVHAHVLSHGVATVFAASLVLSASLLFVLQPMFTKMTLPLLGGAPGVWNTAVAFFQGVLLLGYLYAHGLQRLHSLKAQMAVHAGVLALGCAFLPIAVAGFLGAPPEEGAPALWLLGLYGASVGGPFFAISATAPLLQAWYARTDRPDARDPYYLYAASNVGSLTALLAYPVLIEPMFAVRLQSQGWAVGYLLLAASILGCALLAMRHGRGEAAPAPAAATAARPAARPADAKVWLERGRWTLLAAVPSSLLLGSTTHLATDVASAPFLWVGPLALYLLTFVIVFARRPWISLETATRYAPMAVICAAAMAVLSQTSWLLQAPVHLAAMFVLALACHHRLAAQRPEAGRLTEFYAFMSLGGVIGGSFNAFVAPVAFDGVIEYPLAIAAAAYLGCARAPVSRTGSIAAFGLIAAAVVLAGLQSAAPGEGQLILKAMIIASILALFFLRGAPARFAVAAALFMVGAPNLLDQRSTIFQDRSFFGVWRVEQDGDMRILVHGTTVHGARSMATEGRPVPGSYYVPEGPIAGAVAQTHARVGAARVGVIGLGAGAIACHAAPGDNWTFFEIDPVVARVARDPELFGFLEGCMPGAEIVMGDGRLTLDRQPDGEFDVIIIDAFASDVVPAHLLTREAFEFYMSKLAPDGVLVTHISNRVLELEGPTTDIVHSFGWAARSRLYVAPPERAERYEATSMHVLAIARSDEHLELFAEAGWRPAEAAGRRPWTDDRNNIPGAIWAKRFGW